MLHGVTAVRNAESKLEVKALEYPVSEVVFLYHAKLVHWLVSHYKLNTETKSSVNISELFACHQEQFGKE